MKHSYTVSDNNLDLLRLVLASLVVMIHLANLTLNPTILSYSDTIAFASSRAVPGFFVISGFLIYMSYENSASLSDYYVKRFLRLIPAYYLLIISCAVFLFFLSTATAEQYFSVDMLRYILYNFAFLNFLSPELAGVFTENPVHAVNGALWTLKIEVMFYLVVPLLFKLASRFSALKVFPAIFFSSIFYAYFFNQMSIETGDQSYYRLSYQLPGQMMYFTTGILAYLYFEVLKKYMLGFLILAMCIFYFEIFELDSIALGTVLIYLFMICPYRISLKSLGDLSYGVYIFHFPIIQVLVYLEAFSSNPLILIGVTYALTFSLSYLSWHVVEKRALKLKLMIRR